jgi:hypothetical protein
VPAAVKGLCACLHLSSVQLTLPQPANCSATKWLRALRAAVKANTRCVAQLSEVEPAYWVHVLLATCVLAAGVQQLFCQKTMPSEGSLRHVHSSLMPCTSHTDAYSLFTVNPLAARHLTKPTFFNQLRGDAVCAGAPLSCAPCVFDAHQEGTACHRRQVDLLFNVAPMMSQSRAVDSPVAANKQPQSWVS